MKRVVLGVLALSLAVGAWRGLVYELLCGVGWVVAFFITRLLVPQLAPAVRPYASSWSPTVLYAAVFIVLFIALVFAWGLVAVLAKKLVQMAGLRPVDRVLGACFGAVRGVVVLLVLYIKHRLTRMPIGRAWEALREDEIACRSLGLSPTRIKLTAFTISAAFAGFAGTLFAARQGFVSPESFTFAESAFVLAIVVLGGMGSQFAVILAAILLVVSRELMRDFNEYSMLMLGGLMVLMMIWRPQGLLPMTRPQLKLKNGQAKGEQA